MNNTMIQPLKPSKPATYVFQTLQNGVWNEFARNNSGGLFGIKPPANQPWRVVNLFTSNQIGQVVV
jgi:hypothetical protein